MNALSCRECSSPITGDTRFCPSCGTKVEATSTADFARLRQLYDQALSVEPARRERWLHEACGGDEILRQKLVGMLSNSGSYGAAPQQAALPTIGPYRLIRELGRGGMGVVYLALRDDGAFRKNVALKILLRDQVNDEFIQRFKQERQVLAAADHANIARILDGGNTSDGMPYYVMEYVEGHPIDAYCDEHRLSLTGRIKLFQQVCQAVHYLHQNLIVHRDLKPSNIQVSADGVVKLLDFGIAKMIGAAAMSSPDLTVAGSGPMTPTYASPEQITGSPLQRASDIYSLGVVLYRLLTGRSPYQGLDEKIASIASRTLPPPPSRNIRDDLRATESTAELRRALMGELDSIVLKALELEPDKRYQSAADFANDLQRFLDDLPVTAHHANVAQRSVKMLKRRRLVLAVVVSFVVVGGFGVVQWRRADVTQTEIAQRESKLRALLDELESGMDSPGAAQKTSEQRVTDVKRLQQALQTDYAALAARTGPGGTSDAGPLITRGVRYLDQLRAAHRNDNRLGVEIAATYQQFGVLQENILPRTPQNNTVVINTYQKAVVILINIGPEDQYGAMARNRLNAINVRIEALGGTAQSTQEMAAATPPAKKLPPERPQSPEPPAEAPVVPRETVPPVSSVDRAEIEERMLSVTSKIQVALQAIEPIRQNLESTGQMLNADTSTAARRMQSSLASARQQYEAGQFAAARDSLAAADAFATRVLRSVGR